MTEITDARFPSIFQDATPADTMAANKAAAILAATDIARNAGLASLSARTPLATDAATINSIIRSAGLNCTLADLKAVATAGGIFLPGYTMIRKNDGVAYDALAWSSAEMLRAWCYTYAPTLIDASAPRNTDSLTFRNWW